MSYRLALLYRQLKRVRIYAVRISSRAVKPPRETTSRFIMLQKSNSEKYELFIRKVCQSSHGSKACRFAPWMCPCSTVLGKTRTQSARDGIYGTLLLCSDLQKVKCKRDMLACHIKSFKFQKSSILTGNGLVASCTQGSSLGMIMCFAIWQSLMIEKGASLKLLSAILQNKQHGHVWEHCWKRFLIYEKILFWQSQILQTLGKNPF